MAFESGFLKEILKSKAKELGFGLFGISPAVKLDIESINLKNWLDSGHSALMKNWMERDFKKRINPMEIIQDAHSVISLAHNYFTPYNHSNYFKNYNGKISRYAWGRDYHKIILNKTKILIEILKSHGFETYISVDSGSIMEKAWAVRSGIGWQGKNSLILTKEYGSWVFLATIITNANLIPDEIQTQNLCGSCTLCIDSCPTKAIIDSYKIDARRCISYNTIESARKKCINKEISELSDGFIIGCDICQDVCPWNKKTINTEELSFVPLYDTCLNFNEILKMNLEEFKNHFKDSSILRIGLSGLKSLAEIYMEIYH